MKIETIEQAIVVIEKAGYKINAHDFENPNNHYMILYDHDYHTHAENEDCDDECYEQGNFAYDDYDKFVGIEECAKYATTKNVIKFARKCFGEI